MNKAAILAMTLALVSVWIVLVAGLTARWLTEEARVTGVDDASDGDPGLAPGTVLRLARTHDAPSSR